MLSRQNRLKQKLQEGTAVLGFVCRSLSPTIVELIGMAGFDFVWIDMEHTGASFDTVENLCRAADITEIESLVRVPDKSPSNILRALEVGAGIVNVPQVELCSEAEAVVRAAKYAPIGNRGYCASSRGMRYGFEGPAKEAFARTNERTMTMVQIESARGVENAAEICKVPGLDAVFVGLADLSQSLGISGEFTNPKLFDNARRVIHATRDAGKISAMLVDSIDDAKRWQAEGAQVFCCGVDVPTIGKMLLRIREDFAPLRSRA
jgi:4-hydroxy-2-oxoheptanedioate aldolase